MLQFLLSALAVSSAFGFLIIIHELGHWVAARHFGVRCPSFGVGIGPRVGGFRWRGTEFELRPVPFIGYVMMTGEDTSPEGEEWRDSLHYFLGGAQFPAKPSELVSYLDANKTRLLAESDSAMAGRFRELHEHLTFHPDTVLKRVEECEGNINHKPAWQRLIILLGGIAMNLVAAVIIFLGTMSIFGLAMMGPERTTLITGVSPNSAAEKAGLKKGETVVSVGGERVTTGMEMINAIGRHPGQTVPMEVSAGKTTRSVQITPDVKLGDMAFHEVDGKVCFAFSLLEKKGLKSGTVLESVNGKPVTSTAQLVTLVSSELAQPGPEYTLNLKLADTPEPVQVKGNFDELQPVGKIGITPGSVTVLLFEKVATTTVVTAPPGSPLKPGDTVLSLDGVPVDTGVTTLQAELDRLKGRQEPVVVEVLRGTKIEKVTLVPPALAAEMAGFEPVTPGLIVQQTGLYMQRLTFGPMMMLWDLVSRQKELASVGKEMSGPVDIIRMMASLAHSLPKFLFFLAILNAAIAGTNLVPIPALDGARCLVVIFGALRGRDVNPEKENRVHAVGLVILLGLMAVKSVTEIQNILSGGGMVIK